ncbi:MAG: PadR family transcriptional regulator [Parvularcula sp.]
MAMPLSTLSYALLGLLGRQAQSAYALMKVFETTPMGGYSSSPGAIYPAVAKLKKLNLIAPDGTSPSGRGVNLRLTSEGRSEFVRWLTEPIAFEDVTKRLGDLMLRFTFMDDHLGTADQIRFIDQVKVHLDIQVEILTAAENAMSHTARRNDHLALSAGLLVFKGHSQWAASAREEILERTDEQC